MINFNNTILQARFLAKNNWLQAVKILEEAIHNNPTSIDLLFELADLYLIKNVPKKALNAYQNILKIDNNNSIALFKTGNIYLEIAEPKLAIHHYDRISEFHPEAIFNKALALYKLKKFHEAIDILQILEKNNYLNEHTYYFIIELFFIIDKNDEALQYINKAEMILGKTYQLHYMKGFVFSKQKNWLAAYCEYLNALPGLEKNAKLHQVLGITAENIGQSEKAIQHLVDGLKIVPQEEFMISDLISILVKNNYVDSIDELNKFLDHLNINPDTSKIAKKYYKNFIKKNESNY